MSFLRRGRRSAVRLTIGLGVLAAFPFVGSGVAQAAMAGANPLTTSNRPDLRTVHILNAITAEFCFDKTVANSPPGGGSFAPANFSLGGYRFDTGAPMASVNVESTNTNCILGTPTAKPNPSGPGTIGGRDLKSYSFASVLGNSVRANAGGGGAPGNIGDSTASLDSNSHNGTADHTTGPDLQGVALDTTNNRIVYVMDQQTRSDAAGLAGGTAKFLFYDANGNPHYGQPIAADTTGLVVVAFAPADSVSLAKQAVVIRGSAATEGSPTSGVGAIQEQAGDPQTFNPTESVAVPGTDGLSARPVLQSAALVPGPSNQIDYTFSVPVTTVPGGFANFVAVTSNGQEVQATGETVISPNTVRATFASAPDGLQNFQELIVKASAYCVGAACATNPGGTGGAVNSVNNPRPNQTGGVPVGNNAGAFSTGFSTGPDAVNVTFDSATGTVTAQFDQRVKTANLTGCTTNAGTPPGGPYDTTPADPNNCWVLLASDGTVITGTVLGAAIINNSPFTSQVRLTYNPSDVLRAVAGGALLINGPPAANPGSLPAAQTFTGGGFSPQGSVRQVISPTASAGAFHDPAKGAVKQRWHRLSKSQARKAMARLKRVNRRAHRRHH